MKYRDQGRQQLWQPLYYLTPSFLSSHFLFHPNVIYPPLAFLFSFPSLPERRHMQSQVNTLICGRNLSHPLLSFSHSPHSLCRSSWLTPLCFKSQIPAQFLYLEPSHVHRVFNSVQANELQTTILCLKLYFCLICTPECYECTFLCSLFLWYHMWYSFCLQNTIV